MTTAAKNLLAATMVMLNLPVCFAAQAEPIEEFALDDLVVTATRVASKDLQTAAAVQVITHEEL